jgi:hypothetical protein
MVEKFHKLCSSLPKFILLKWQKKIKWTKIQCKAWFKEKNYSQHGEELGGLKKKR